MKVKDFFEVALATILGFISTFCKQYGVILTMVCIVIVIDFISGLIKSKLAGNIESGIARKGFFKKIALLVALFFGMFLDWFAPLMLSSINIELSFAMPFAMIIGCYIIINECISIAENLYEINPNTVPKFIVKCLKIAQEKINGIDNKIELQEKTEGLENEEEVELNE